MSQPRAMECSNDTDQFSVRARPTSHTGLQNRSLTMNYLEKKSLPNYKKQNRQRVSCPRPFGLRKLATQVLVNTEAALLTENTFQISNHFHQKADVVLRAQNTRSSDSFLYLPLCEAGRKTKRARSLLEQCYPPPSCLTQGSVALYIRVQQVPKALPWLTLPHVASCIATGSGSPGDKPQSWH